MGRWGGSVPTEKSPVLGRGVCKSGRFIDLCVVRIINSDYYVKLQEICRKNEKEMSHKTYVFFFDFARPQGVLPVKTPIRESGKRKDTR